jgi:carbamoyl-phosphate synthase large subunit
MKARVLFTCAGGTMVPDLLTHLRSDPILQPYLVGVDASAAAAGRDYVDAFYQVPWADDPVYVDEVARIVAREKIDLVFPSSDEEAFRLSAEREKISTAGAVVLASPVAVLDLIRDKRATYEALRSAGLRIPEFSCVETLDALQASVGDYGYPRRSVIVKPVAGRGGRGVRLLLGADDVPAAWIGGGAREKRIASRSTPEEMHSWFAEGALMVMPLLQAPVHDVDVFAVRGRARAALVRRRTNPAGIPFAGNRIMSDPTIMKYCLEIAEAIGLDGLHDIDLMTDGQGRPCLLEVNPRPSGSVVAAHAAGFPVVAAAIAETLGTPYPLRAPERDIDVGMAPCAIVMVESPGRP